MNCDFQSVPNQKRFFTHREKCDEENHYTKINNMALQKAMKELTPKAFEVWIYFSKWIDDKEHWLSKVDCLKWCNIGKTSYYNAIQELKDKGYIIERAESNNTLDFYQIPKDKE